MKKTMLLWLLSLTILLPQVISAFPYPMAHDGPYASVGGGANFLNHLNNEKIHYKFKTGYTVTGALGIRFCYNWRTEAEAAYHHNEISRIKKHHRLMNTHTGNFHSWSYMLNLYYDFNQCWLFTPYFGIGAGWSNNKFQFKRRERHHVQQQQRRKFIQMLIGTKKNRNDLKRHRFYANHENGFVYQLIAGATVPVNECSDFSVEYRFYNPRLNRDFNQSVNLIVRYYY